MRTFIGQSFPVAWRKCVDLTLDDPMQILGGLCEGAYINVGREEVRYRR